MPRNLLLISVSYCDKTMLSENRYINDITGDVITCPQGYLYNAILCQCVSAQESPGLKPDGGNVYRNHVKR